MNREGCPLPANHTLNTANATRESEESLNPLALVRPRKQPPSRALAGPSESFVANLNEAASSVIANPRHPTTLHVPPAGTIRLSRASVRIVDEVIGTRHTAIHDAGLSSAGGRVRGAGQKWDARGRVNVGAAPVTVGPKGFVAEGLLRVFRGVAWFARTFLRLHPRIRHDASSPRAVRAAISKFL